MTALSTSTSISSTGCLSRLSDNPISFSRMLPFSMFSMESSPTEVFSTSSRRDMIPSSPATRFLSVSSALTRNLVYLPLLRGVSARQNNSSFILSRRFCSRSLLTYPYMNELLHVLVIIAAYPTVKIISESSHRLHLPTKLFYPVYLLLYAGI